MQEFQYFKPTSAGEAAELLGKYGKDARILAGGTDLLVLLREKVVECRYMVDIKAIPELNVITYSKDEGLFIGAAVCLNDIINSAEISKYYPILVQAAKGLANSLLRNRATLVGNLCNASPGGDMLAPSIVLGGRAEIVSAGGKRSVPLDEFFLGVKKTALKGGELVSGIVYPPSDGKGIYLRKSRIKGHDLAQVSIAAYLDKSRGLRLCVGAAGPTPVIVRGFENYSSSDVVKNKSAIISKVLGEIKPIGDQRASLEYRTAMVGYLAGQALDELGKE